jgi:hypothetical protein
MARGRKTSFIIRLTPAERLTLLTWQRATTISAGVARRARLLLLLAGGMTITDAAATVGLSRRHAYKWIQWFVQERLTGLADKLRHDCRIALLPPDLRSSPRTSMLASAGRRTVTTRETAQHRPGGVQGTGGPGLPC